MNHFLTFAAHHWILFLLLILLVIALFVVESQGAVGGILQISAQHLVTLMNREKALVIDVREPAAFEAGHILHAQNISLAQLDQAVKRIQKFKAKPIAVYGKGQDSLAVKLAKQLKQKGFKNVQCLRGGLQAWQKQNYPLSKPN